MSRVNINSDILIGDLNNNQHSGCDAIIAPTRDIPLHARPISEPWGKLYLFVSQHHVTNTSCAPKPYCLRHIEHLLRICRLMSKSQATNGERGLQKASRSKMGDILDEAPWRLYFHASLTSDALSSVSLRSWGWQKMSFSGLSNSLCMSEEQTNYNMICQLPLQDYAPFILSIPAR